MVVGSRGGIVCFGGGYLGFGLGKIMFERKNNVEDEEEGEEDEAEEEEKEKEKGEGNSSLSKNLLDLAPPNHSLLIQLNKTIVTIHYLVIQVKGEWDAGNLKLSLPPQNDGIIRTVQSITDQSPGSKKEGRGIKQLQKSISCKYKIKHSVNYFGIATEMDNIISVFPTKKNRLRTTRYSLEDSLDKHSVKGKIVLCDLIQASDDVGILSGAAGVIFGLNYPQDLRGTYALPALQIAQRDQRLIHSYITSTRFQNKRLTLKFRFSFFIFFFLQDTSLSEDQNIQRKDSENPVDENDASNLLPSTESYRSMGEILSSMDPENHLPMPVIESGSGKQTITLSDRHSREGAM
ncbi:hypothetical protein JHK87_055962 [Glycine soja]|nr:hypothetical protein JHK87_055962 [Glycine soja]